MPPVTRYCPKCGSVLNVPHPAPEKMACPKCGAVLKFATPAKSTAQAVHTGASRSAGPASPAIVAPRTVAGHQLQRELARGGLGVIYLAFHPHFNAFRAIKRPLPGDAADRDVVLGRFRREVQAVAEMQSPHVIRAYDAGEDGDGPYLVTEYLDGEALSGLVTRLCMLPVPEACEIVRQAALGLQAAHERGLVHRDVKPSNLMVARGGAGAGRVVVIDWGLVKSAADVPTNRLTRVHTEMGTLDFIAPEQILDAHSVDIRADIYSLGVTLYCLLAGRTPFADRTDDEKRIAHAQEKFPRLDQLRPTIPRPVLDILEKMVKKKPAERYQTPGEVARALLPFGCEPHQLLALLAPGASAVPTPRPASQTPPLQMQNILEAGTVLAPAAPPSSPPVRSAPAPAPAARGRGLLLVGLAAVAVCCLLVCGGGVLGVMLWGGGTGKDKDTDGGTKDKPSGNGPQVLIDENFKEAYDNRAKSTLPKNWEGDAYHLTKDSDEACLESTKPAEAAWVKLPQVALDGDFLIEGVYHMMVNETITVRLENTKANALLPIIFHNDGRIIIGDDARAAPSGFKINQPARFAIKREGKKLRVFINDDVVDKELKDITEFDSIKMCLYGHYFNRPVHFYRVKVLAGKVDGPPESFKPTAANDKKGKGK